jgi:hypothetical protein
MSPATAVPPPASKTILVVEDDDMLRERPDVAIIAISGAERVLRDPHAVERLGIRMLLEKPVSGPDLVEAVRRTLAPG